MMQIKAERDYQSILVRIFAANWLEIAYLQFGICGLQLEIEFPSDWHEPPPRAWIRIGLGFMKICFSFPWSKTVPDDFQCSGPTYGFQFYEDLLWIRYGKAHGRRDDPCATFYMPWHWKFKVCEKMSNPETYAYFYTLKNGNIQARSATIQVERREWFRTWLPCRRVVDSIDVEFNEEVGERTGSWKGGCIGCSYEMRRGETPLETLRRMEREREFT